jgi:hypothetical protein
MKHSSKAFHLISIKPSSVFLFNVYVSQAYNNIVVHTNPIIMASGGARVSGAWGQLTCLSPPPGGHVGIHRATFFFLFWLIASLLIRLSIHSSLHE